MALKTRDGVILYQQTESDTKQEIVDLKGLDPISAIYLEVECTNGATSNKANYISDIVTKIEVVDGSDVIISLNGSQAEALHFYHNKQMPVLFPSELASGLQRHGFYINFGRWLWDPLYCLIPGRYRNPQLKVTFNKAAIRAAGATGFAAGDNIKLTVVAKLMEEGATPIGLLMQKQVDSFTSAASGDKRIELPTDFVYRKILVRYWKQLSDIDEIITDLKLTANTDKYIPFNRKVKQLDAEAFAQFGHGRLKHDIITQHQEAFRMLFNKEPSLSVYSWEDASPPIIGIRYTWSSEGKLDLISDAGVLVTVDQAFTAVEEGHSLHATLPICFGRYYEPETWFDPATYEKLELVHTQGVASAVCEIVVEQVRP